MHLLNRFMKLNVPKMMFVVMLVSLALGCSKKPELIGMWENTSVPEMIEFKQDSTGIIQGKNMPPLTFAWKESGPNTYNLDVNFQGQKKALKGVLQDKGLTLEGEHGKETYRKVSSK